MLAEHNKYKYNYYKYIIKRDIINYNNNINEHVEIGKQSPLKQEWK